MVKKFSALFLAVIFLCLANSFVFAQEKTGFAVTPPSFEINAKPGDVIQNTIKIENLNKAPLTIRARPQSFVAYGEGGQVAISEDETTFSIISWVELEKAEQNIKPESFALYNFKLHIPKNAEPGSHYGAIVFSPVKDTSVGGSGANVSQEIGALILIKIPGDVFESAELLSFNPEEQIVKTDEVKLIAQLSNNGNIHVKPYGYIAIYNLLGAKVKTIEVRGRNILPGSKRLFEEKFKFNGFGFYTSELTLLYAGGGKLLHSKTSFIILNLAKTGALIITGFIILLIIIIFRKRFKKAMKILLKG